MNKSHKLNDNIDDTNKSRQNDDHDERMMKQCELM